MVSPSRSDFSVIRALRGWRASHLPPRGLGKCQRTGPLLSNHSDAFVNDTGRDSESRPVAPLATAGVLLCLERPIRADRLYPVGDRPYAIVVGGAPEQSDDVLRMRRDGCSVERRETAVAGGPAPFHLR